MLLAALPAPSSTGDLLVAFLSILFASAPYLFIGTLLSGLIHVFLPVQFLDRVVPRNKILAALLAGLLGIVLPVSKCVIIPVTRRLIQKGLPLPFAVTYLLAAPIVNPIAALSTFAAFNEYQNVLAIGDLRHASMTIARLSLGYLVAVIVGLVISFFKPTQILRAPLAEAPTPEPVGFNAKLTAAMRATMSDFLDMAMYFTIGALLVSIFNTQISEAKLPSWLGNDFPGIPCMMGLAVVLSLCSTSDAFVAAPMMAFSLASKLAFLVIGPMVDMQLLFVYSTVFKRRIIIALTLGLFILIGLLSGPWMHFIQSLASNTKP